jgi:hypothetical protein
MMVQVLEKLGSCLLEEKGIDGKGTNMSTQVQ